MTALAQITDDLALRPRLDPRRSAILPRVVVVVDSSTVNAAVLASVEASVTASVTASLAASNAAMAAALATPSSQRFSVADGNVIVGQTTISVSPYTPGALLVFVNGSKLPTNAYTATSGASVVLADPIQATDVVEVLSWLMSGVQNAAPISHQHNVSDILGLGQYTLTALGGKPDVLGNVAALQAASVPAPIAAVTVDGYTAAGDCGGGRYRRISAPSSPKRWQVQSADGAWWELTGDDVDVRQFGGVGGPASSAVSALPDDSAALQAMFDYVGLTGGRIKLPGNLVFRTNQALYLRIQRQLASWGTDLDNIHFSDNSRFRVDGCGGGTIIAGAAMASMLTIQYNVPLSNLGPFQSEISGLTLNGNGLATTCITSDYVMDLSVTDCRIFGPVQNCMEWVGYGVARISKNVLQGPVCIRLMQGGGDSIIYDNDFYHTDNGVGVELGTWGGDTTIFSNVFSGSAHTNVTGVLIVNDGTVSSPGDIRHIRVRDNEFSGMAICVYSSNTTGHSSYGFIIEGNHTTPGTNICTGILCNLIGASESRVRNNTCNSSHQTIAAQTAMLFSDCDRISVSDNNITNYSGAAIYCNNVTNSQFAGNIIQDTGQQFVGGVVIDLDGASSNNDFLDNIIRQTSSSYAQNGIYERAGATGNFGRNRFSGVGAPATTASGSTSTYTAR